MPKKILVLGATGTLGQPTTRRLKQDGFQVRIMVRDVDKAHSLFDQSVEILQGDVTEQSNLEKAIQGCAGVHVSVGGPVDQVSAENVAELAPMLGVEHVTYLSGSTVSEANSWFPMTKQKLLAEKVIQECGVAYTILRPTWPMEQLPRFVMGGRATVIGIISDPWHWFAAGDLARMVSNAYQNPEAKNKCLFIHGPEGIPVKDALERYCKAFHPEIEAVTILPIPAARAMAESTGNVFIKNFADLMDYFKKVGEPGDPTEANQILGAPEITLDAWIDGNRR